MPIKFLVVGGVFWVWGGGKCRLYFYGGGIFLKYRKFAASFKDKVARTLQNKNIAANSRLFGTRKAIATFPSFQHRSVFGTLGGPKGSNRTSPAQRSSLLSLAPSFCQSLTLKLSNSLSLSLSVPLPLSLSLSLSVLLSPPLSLSLSLSLHPSVSLSLSPLALSLSLYIPSLYLSLYLSLSLSLSLSLLSFSLSLSLNLSLSLSPPSLSLSLSSRSLSLSLSLNLSFSLSLSPSLLVSDSSRHLFSRKASEQLLQLLYGHFLGASSVLGGASGVGRTY